MADSPENDQRAQRRANLASLADLGVPIYPHGFRGTNPDRDTDTVSALVDAHGAASGADLESAEVRTATAGRILIVRSFGKARFLVISDGRKRIQVYVRQDALSERDFRVAALLDIGDHIGVEGRLFRHPDRRADGMGVPDRVPGQMSSAVAGKMARSDRCRDPLPAAVPGLDRQPRVSRGVRGAVPGAGLHPPVSGASGARVSRSRDPDDAVDRGRRPRPAVRDASQRAGHGPVSAYRAPSSISSDWSSAASSGSSRSTGTSGTKASRRTTTRSSRCSSSIRPTATTVT